MKKNKNAVLILLNYGIVVALLLMIAIFSFASKNFFRTYCMYWSDNGYAHWRY